MAFVREPGKFYRMPVFFSMFYATVSKGFKSGGFDATDRDPYFPEYVTAYTV